MDLTEKSLYEAHDAESEENMETLFAASSRITEDLSTPRDVLICFPSSTEDEFTLMGGTLQVLRPGPSWCVKAGPCLLRDRERPRSFPAAPVCFASCRDMPGCPACAAHSSGSVLPCREKVPVVGVVMFAELVVPPSPLTSPARSRISPALSAAAGRGICSVMGRVMEVMRGLMGKAGTGEGLAVKVCALGTEEGQRKSVMAGSCTALWRREDL